MSRAWLTLLLPLLLAGCRTPDHWYRRGHHSTKPRLKIRYLTRALEMKPEHQQALRERGAAYLALDQPREAIEDLTGAIARDPDDSLSYRQRGLAHLRLRQFKQARADLARANALAPLALEVQFNLAQLEEQQGNDAKAIAAYTQVIGRDKTHAMAYRFRARLRFKQGKLTLARLDYRKLLAHGEALPRAMAYNELVLTWLAADKPEIALQVLAEGLRAFPAMPDLTFLSGALAYLQGNYRKADAHFGDARARRYQSGYCFLFSALTTQHVHKMPHAKLLKKVLEREKLAGWPRPLIEAFAGLRESQDALETATNPAQTSEAGYYLGELALIDGKPKLAQKYFALAAKSTSFRTPEKYLARLRLRKR